MAIFNSRAVSLNAKLRCTNEAPATATYTIRVPAGKVLGTGDTLNFITIPAGYRILEARLIAGDLDSDGTPALTLNFGYSEAGGTADPDAFLAGSTVGQAGGTVVVTNGGDDPFAVGVLAAGSLDRVITVIPAVAADAGPATATDISVTVTVVKDSFGADANTPYEYRDRYGNDSNSAN